MFIIFYDITLLFLLILKKKIEYLKLHKSPFLCEQYTIKMNDEKVRRNIKLSLGSFWHSRMNSVRYCQLLYKKGERNDGWNT